MKKTRKILAMAACAVLLVCISVGATVAYLTSTDSVTNTFTVGKVKITLDETLVGPDGREARHDPETGKLVPADEDTAERTKSNSYKLMPGGRYLKDPTVTVKAGSSPSYIRMIVTVTFQKELTKETLATKLDGIFEQYSATHWPRHGDPVVTVANGKTTVKYEYRYNGWEGNDPVVTVSETADKALPSLFSWINIPSEWDNDEMQAFGGFTIDIIAQAVQADGFGTADEAWNATFDKP